MIVLVVIYCLSLSTKSYGGISDFYVVTDTGTLAYVNGDTLVASAIHHMQNPSGLSDILYDGNGVILANTFGRIRSINTVTGQEELVFDSTSHPDTQGVVLMGGLARTSRGTIYMVSSGIGLDVNNFYSSEFNQATDRYVQSSQLSSELGLLFDYHEVDEHTYLAADFVNQTIHVFDSTGVGITKSYQTGLDVVSFFQDQDSIFAFTRTGDLHTFDPDSGSLSFYGSVAGRTVNFIGATIPAPGPTSFVGVLLLSANLRRRR